MAGDFDIERPDGDQRERGIILLVVVLIVSCAVHIGLMYACSDYAFAPMPGEMKVDHGRKWTKELPTMQVRKLADDPVVRQMLTPARPVAAPDTEKPEDRVNRLASTSDRTVVPELPRAASTMPIADATPEPAKVDAAEWQPRQKIAAVEAPVVPDDEAALPRVVIPKVERVAHAADIVPSFDLIQSPGTASGNGAGGGGTVFQSASLVSAAEESAAGAAPVAAPLPPAAGAHGVPRVFSGEPPKIDVLSAAEEAAAKRAADDERAAGKAANAAKRMREEERARAEKRPVPPAPQTAQVDEKVVAKEKEAVRALRDETTSQGRPFEKHVSLGLGAWIDPAHPEFKYFRVSVSSRAEQPLPVIAKDIVFLLDASGSIANDRLKKCRRSVVKALRMLNTGDRFNIVAFRDKFTFAFPHAAWVDVSEKTLDEAEDWLSYLSAHGQTDVFRTLKGVLAMPRDPARPVVAFVITDGEPTSGMTRNAEIISRFSELNGGLVSVYMYGVKDTANAYLMDMLTRGSRGSWSRNEKSRWFAADGIPELAKKFERPVLSDVSVLFSASSRAETYPQLVSNLCEDEPIEIFGVCPAAQEELVFSMRGLNGSTVYENVFRLPFGSAERLGADVKTAWAQRRLYALIAAYTARPDKALLRDIHLFATTYKIEIPYEKEIRK